MWLASGALLAYAALADFGIFGVMPWLIAEADGAKDIVKIRSLLSHGLVVGVFGGGLYVLAALVLWVFFPRFLHLTAADQQILRGPIFVMTAATAVGFPLRLFSALRSGLQDVKFMGGLAVAQTLLSALLIVGFLRLGFGLYAVAIGSAVPPVGVGLASLVRTVVLDRSPLHSWPRFRWSNARPIFVGGAGSWLGTLGWQLAFATDAVVLASLGYRDHVPMFAITSRLGLTLMQFAWALPDSASIGLAQLNAEGTRERVTETVSALLRMHLLLVGGVICVVLAVNAGLVRVWIGPDLYGGTRLTAFFAADVVALSVAHALCVPAAVLGRRLSIGVVTLVNGALHILLALLLGKRFGLEGVAAATFISALTTTIPVSAVYLREQTMLNLRTLTGLVASWSIRVLPCATAAALTGWLCAQASLTGRLGSRAPLVLGIAAAAILGVIYLYSMRTITRDLPFGARIRRVLGAFRLV